VTRESASRFTSTGGTRGRWKHVTLCYTTRRARCHGRRAYVARGRRPCRRHNAGAAANGATGTAAEGHRCPSADQRYHRPAERRSDVRGSIPPIGWLRSQPCLVPVSPACVYGLGMALSRRLRSLNGMQFDQACSCVHRPSCATIRRMCSCSKRRLTPARIPR
jgi:hypothetical protein